MITIEEYKKALNVVNKYRKQLSLSFVSDSSSFDLKEWLKCELMATSDITLEEFEDAFNTWLSMYKKKIQIDNFDKNYRQH